WEKEAVVGDAGDPAQPFGAVQKVLYRVGLEVEQDRQLANPRWSQIATGEEERVNALPKPLIRPGQTRLVFGQTPDRALTHGPARGGKLVERRVKRSIGCFATQLPDQDRPAGTQRVRLCVMPRIEHIDDPVPQPGKPLSGHCDRSARRPDS